MRALPAILVAAFLLALAGAAGYLAVESRRLAQTYYTDAEDLRAPVGDAPVRDILWKPPVTVGVSSDIDDYEPRLSADGSTLLFVRGKPGSNSDIFIATRTLDGWSEPEPLPINSPHNDLGPCLAPDNRTLYFYSDREGSLGGYDIWVSTRTDDGWSEPRNLGAHVNTPFNEYNPAATGDALWFSSNRPRPETDHDPDAWPATVREDLYEQDYDLYTCAITEHGLERALPVEALNTESNEGQPALSPVGDFLYFASDRPGGEGAFDIWRARIVRGEIQPPTNVGPQINTLANDLDPTLAMGGFELYFSSDRHAVEGGSSYDIYASTSREVFLESDPLDFGKIFGELWPALLLLLLLLLFLLLLLLLLRNGNARNFYRRLSLLAKCIIASAIVHMLLLLLFAFLHVTNTIGTPSDREGGTRIAIASPRANALSRQVRGSMTSGDAVQPLEVESERAETTSERMRLPVALVAVDRAPVRT
ncbi:MAG: PD40 domain-containing protein, partial [Phycisphaerales bacterium]|nr:PD40 domain-containing protein [Phycisphaerales bacterium]